MTQVSQTTKNLVDIDLAHVQGDLFEYVAKHNYDVFDFIDTFMNDKDTAMHLDIRYSWLQTQPPHIMLHYLPETERSLHPSKTNKTVSPDTAWWIGYAYRLLCRKKGLTSQEIVTVLTPRLMAELYGTYHTFTNDTYMIERLYEDYIMKKQHETDNVATQNRKSDVQTSTI